MTQILEAIDKMGKLNLMEAKPDEITNLLNNFKGVNTLPINIRTDNYIIRARYFSENEYLDSINKGINLYSHVDLGHNPNPSKKYGRCSIPGGQVFYGTLPTDKVNEETIRNALASSIVEASGLTKNARSISSEKYAYILCSLWQVHRPLIVLPILNNLKLVEKSAFLKAAGELHKASIAKFHKDRANDYNAINDFLAAEFSKSVINHEEYKISAHFSHTVLTYGDFDGILYPSVAGEGDGLNLACKISVINSKAITPIKAMVFRLKYGDPNQFIQIMYCDDLSKGNTIRWSIVPFHD